MLTTLWQLIPVHNLLRYSPPLRRNSGDKTQRARPTTLDIPGLTKSSVSPDGKIAARDVGAKLVIVMVGLPARGKSYITKKMARYLNWLQHDTRIFNVGERRRVAAGGSRTLSSTSNTTEKPQGLYRNQSANTGVMNGVIGNHPHFDGPTLAAHMLLNGESAIEKSPEQRDHLPVGVPTPVRIPELVLPESSQHEGVERLPETSAMDQSADFFDPSNHTAALIREQAALDTLDDLLDYILEQGGSVGILDATNSTIARRKLVMKTIRERAGPDLNVLFMESVCVDKDLLERNMRLKLSGPDYKDKDPEASLLDFRKRVAIYEKNYVALGEDEEKNKVSYVQMIDVGRKVISHQINGFLMAQAVYYLLNFNLAPRQIWITRHGESQDNLTGKLGGDSELTPAGIAYSKALASFLTKERKIWEIRELEREAKSHFPPQVGDTTPPNPHFVEGVDGHEEHILQKSFCVWTSMLKRSVQTAQFFNEDDWDIKQMRMLDELNAGMYEGYTYEEIKTENRETFDQRRRDKLLYRYPGPGGEGYLDVINRLRPVIVELERMTDHVLLIGHRSVARILMAYFKGLPRDDVTDLDIPIGMLYCLEPVSQSSLVTSWTLSLTHHF